MLLAEAHVQAGSALGSPPVISRVNWAVWPVWTVSAAGAREAVSGGGVTRRLAEAVAVRVPRVTVAAMAVVPAPVPVAEHPEAVCGGRRDRAVSRDARPGRFGVGVSAGDLEGELGGLARLDGVGGRREGGGERRRGHPEAGGSGGRERCPA